MRRTLESVRTASPLSVAFWLAQAGFWISLLATSSETWEFVAYPIGLIAVVGFGAWAERRRRSMRPEDIKDVPAWAPWLALPLMVLVALSLFEDRPFADRLPDLFLVLSIAILIAKMWLGEFDAAREKGP